MVSSTSPAPGVYRWRENGEEKIAIIADGYRIEPRPALASLVPVTLLALLLLAIGFAIGFLARPAFALSEPSSSWLGAPVSPRIATVAVSAVPETQATQKAQDGGGSVRASEAGEDSVARTPAGSSRLVNASGNRVTAEPSALASPDAAARANFAIASWYGPGFYGKRTACGQTYTPTIRGVAHRSLPCGTLVAIEYGGRTAVVPVIDRGPFIVGRLWDLSAATRAALQCPDLCPVSWWLP